ncbi:MAG: hypothetical protein K6F84_08890 [Lachnospiraceae bacterium]|nr:hypothetical protein [Lachnospiraceae bacterium]
MWSRLVDIFHNYTGVGFAFILYLAAVCYLFVRERNKNLRFITIYMPAVILLIYFNPVVASLIFRVVESEIYFRMLWLIPVSVTVAYTVAKLWKELKGRVRAVAVSVCLVLVILSGRLVYTHSLYSVSTNVYHVPHEVCDICDAIMVEGREVMAAFPSDSLLYVRQYTARVCMPYGRNGLQYGSSLLNAINSYEKDFSVIASKATEKGCHFCIIKKDSLYLNDPSDYGFSVFYETPEHIVYRNEAVELIIPGDI